MGLKSTKPWDLKDGDNILWRGDHYRVTNVTTGRPSIGWTTIHTTARDGLSTVLMIEGDERVSVVAPANFDDRVRWAQKKGNQRR